MVTDVINWNEMNGVHNKYVQSVVTTKLDGDFEFVNPFRPIQARKEISISGFEFTLGGRANSIFFSTEISSYKLHQEQLSEESMMLAAKWKTLVLDRSAGSKAKDLTKTTEPVFEALLKFGPSAIDLRNLPEELINGSHLAVVLRATFTRRAEVPGWRRALQIAKKNLESSGANVKSVLGGLI